MPTVVIETKDGFYKDLYKGDEVENFILGFREGRNAEKLRRSNLMTIANEEGSAYELFVSHFELGIALGKMIIEKGEAFEVGMLLGKKNTLLNGKLKVV